MTNNTPQCDGVTTTQRNNSKEQQENNTFSM